MKRRDFIKLTATAAAGLEASQVFESRELRAETGSAKSGRPNILMITAHDIGRHIGCYGIETVRTPSLDALAAKGVRFDCELQNDAVNVLKSCIGVGLTQSILSAYPQSRLEETIDFYELRHYFTKVVGLNNHYVCSKIEQSRQLMEELGFLPGEVLFVGDTVHDFEVAKAIGVDCVLVYNGHNHPDKLRPCGVRVLNSMAEVTCLLS